MVILWVCVRVPEISEISGTGHCSAMLLSPKQRALPGELWQLLLKLTGCVVREEKLLKLFLGNVQPRPCYMVQYFKNWSSFWEQLSFFAFNWDAGRLKNVFSVWEPLLQLGGSRGMWWTGNGFWRMGWQWLANCSLPRKGHCRPPQDVLQAYRKRLGIFTFRRDAAR